MTMDIFTKKITQGFTLLETLASVAVLSLVIIGPLSVTISSSGYARLTKDTIVATYLAEEAIELLQNQYDSMYIFCKKNASSTEPGGYCDPAGTTETSTGQTAWRLFKDKLSGAGGQVTCFLPKGENNSYPGNQAGNANGCAFDYVNLQASSTEPLVRYDAASSDCKYLVPVSTSTSVSLPVTSGGGQYGSNTGDEGEGSGGNQEHEYEVVTATTTSYICKGVQEHAPSGGKVLAKEYVRTITIDQVPTFETGNQNEQYNDDLRITSNVQFKGLNGLTHNIKITRFMHARP